MLANAKVLVMMVCKMFGRMRKTPEQELSHEQEANEKLFARVSLYGKLLLDVAGRDEAISTTIVASQKTNEFGVCTSVFKRTERGFKIEYYLHSERPMEIATFENVSEDSFGPQAYESTFINCWLPYDQTSYCEAESFVKSLEKMFGQLPADGVIDQVLR